MIVQNEPVHEEMIVGTSKECEEKTDSIANRRCKRETKPVDRFMFA